MLARFFSDAESIVDFVDFRETPVLSDRPGSMEGFGFS